MENRLNRQMVGKQRRLAQILSLDNKCVVVPVDDSLIAGPEDGLFDLKEKLKQIEDAKPDAIMCFSGSAQLCNNASIPLILNLTASTLLGQHTNKVLVSTVEHAVYIGANAVAVHMNLSSRYESEMLKNILQISDDCNKYGMPLLILAYPRSEIFANGKLNDNNYLKLKSENEEEYAKLVAHTVRIAFELGADIIKTQYTGSQKTFEKVVKSAPDIPVLIAGGSKINTDALFAMIEASIDAGGAGVSIGRNVFNQTYSEYMIEAVKSIVHKGENALTAKKIYESLVRDNKKACK